MVRIFPHLDQKNSEYGHFHAVITFTVYHGQIGTTFVLYLRMNITHTNK